MTLQETLESNSCVLLLDQTSEQEMVDLDRELPSDMHLVVTDKGVYGVRSYKAVDIFDSFYDEGHQVKEIRSGFGRIKPKLFQGFQRNA